MEKEIWKDLPESDGIYRISNMGRAVSYKYGQAKILKPCKDKDGYVLVKPMINGRMYYFKMHRLVAMLFIENPNNYPEVNHEDGNKANNAYTNLSWVNSSMNKLHAHRTGLNKGFRNKTTKLSRFVMQIDKLSRFVMQIDKDGNMVDKFPSITIASRATGTDDCTILYHANKAAKGLTIKGGTKWRYCQ